MGFRVAISSTEILRKIHIIVPAEKPSLISYLIFVNETRLQKQCANYDGENVKSSFKKVVKTKDGKSKPNFDSTNIS